MSCFGKMAYMHFALLKIGFVQIKPQELTKTLYQVITAKNKGLINIKFIIHRFIKKVCHFACRV